jgi:Protein of unknown function (DUF4239)
VNVVWGALIVAAAAAGGITAMLLVRRRAPEGSYFSDGDRASGVFGVLATGFSVLLGFIVFLAFTSYDQSRIGAEQEALVLQQQVETAQFFPPAMATELTGELICYGRSVVHDEWPRSEAGQKSDDVNPWGVELFQTVVHFEPGSAKSEAAYGKWLDQTSERESARSDRMHGAVGVIPTPLWIVLVLLSAVIFCFMLFFADSGERAKTQAVLMGSVATVIASLLLLINFLDNPFTDGVGGVQPVAMQRTLGSIDEALAKAGRQVEAPCDALGHAK